MKNTWRLKKRVHCSTYLRIWMEKSYSHVVFLNLGFNLYNMVMEFGLRVNLYRRECHVLTSITLPELHADRITHGKHCLKRQLLHLLILHLF